MSTDNENTIEYAEYFSVSDTGVISLKPEACGTDGSLLPEKLVIPELPDANEFAPGIFANNTQIKELTLPSNVTHIPEEFCRNATNLQVINNTDHIESIGASAFMSTNIKEASFSKLSTLGAGAFLECACLEVANIGTVTEIPQEAFKLCTLLQEVSTGNVTTIGKSAFLHTRIKNALFPHLGKSDTSDRPGTLGVGAFAGCAYLEVADIGQITTIPMQAFTNCVRLREVIGSAQIRSIGQVAFLNTRDLRTLPALDPNGTLGNGAFLYSGINTASLPTNNAAAFPTFDHAATFWTSEDRTACRNRLATKLSQNNSLWKSDMYLDDYDETYETSAAFFTVMHIHSAITGKYYSHPDEFVRELRSDPKLAQFLLYFNRPGDFKNVASMFEALGHHTEVHGNGNDLDTRNFQALEAALTQGAYIYVQVPTLNNWMNKQANLDHAVVIYGINTDKEILVLDSNVLHEKFRDGGFEANIDIYTYAIPFQNIVRPGSNFVIVYPREKEPVVEWTGTAATDLFAPNSKPSEYPANSVFSYPVVDGQGTPDGQNGVITVHRVGDYAYRTFVPYNSAALYMQMKSTEENTEANNDNWLNWSGPFAALA